MIIGSVKRKCFRSSSSQRRLAAWEAKDRRSLIMYRSARKTVRATERFFIIDLITTRLMERARFRNRNSSREGYIKRGIETMLYDRRVINLDAGPKGTEDLFSGSVRSISAVKSCLAAMRDLAQKDSRV